MSYIQIEVDDALRKMNEGTVSEDRISDYHNIIYTTIFGDPPTEPNLFSTSGLNYFYCRHQDFNFYNNLLVYLTKYLTEFTPDKQLMYIKYVCECVHVDPSRYTKDNAEVNTNNLVSFVRVATDILNTLFNDRLISEDEKNRLALCIYWPEETPRIDIGGKSKNRNTKKRKTKKRKTKKRKSKRPKSTRKRV